MLRSNGIRTSVACNVLIKKKGGSSSFENDSTGNQPIRLYLWKDRTFKSKEENLKKLIPPIVKGVEACLEKSNMKDTAIYRLLIYSLPNEDFYSVLVLCKFPSEKLNAVNMRYFLARTLKDENVFPFYINSYKSHEAFSNCVWDVHHSKSDPLIDLDKKEINELVHGETKGVDVIGKLLLGNFTETEEDFNPPKPSKGSKAKVETENSLRKAIVFESTPFVEDPEETSVSDPDVDGGDGEDVQEEGGG
jgi:hypothetical protein